MAMACWFVHTQQKSPKIASSVGFDSARHHIIQNRITHHCVVAANCSPVGLAKAVILFNMKKMHCPVLDYIVFYRL